MATKQGDMSIMTDSMADDIVIIPEDIGMKTSFGEKDQFEPPEKSMDAQVQCNPVINKQKLEIELLSKNGAGEKGDEPKPSEFDENSNETESTADEAANGADNTEEEDKKKANDKDETKKVEQLGHTEELAPVNTDSEQNEGDDDDNENITDSEDEHQEEEENEERNEEVEERNDANELPNRGPVENVWMNNAWFLIFSVVVVIVAAGFFIFIKHVGDSFKPEITFEQENIHVLPSKEEWRIKAGCQTFSADQIVKCVWKQLEPSPGSVDSTVIQGGTKECLKISSKKIDASLENLKVPNKHGKYKFKLTCMDNDNRTNTHQFFVMISKEPSPIVYDIKNHLNVSIEVGSVQLRAKCRPMRGRIVKRWWEYVSGPPDAGEIIPDKDGHIKFLKPGVYKFEFKCKDSYGKESQSNSTGSIVRVAVKPPYVLGIDLGTSTTCVSYITEDGRKEDIKLNGDGDAEVCMPSVVAFAENGELLIGKKALNQAVINPLSTIYEVKRLMGQNFYDVDADKFVYRVRPTLKSHSSKGTRAAIDIPCKGHKSKLIQPEVISALILHRVVEIAQTKLGVTIKNVMISVPAQFDDAQRKATMDAGLIAGLNPQKIVNEPTVAAFAAATFIDDLRGTENEAEASEPKDTTSSVVVDIGGGTTDFSYMQIKGSYYKVITTDGNKTLGGRDLDIRLAETMTKIFKKRIKDPGIDLGNPKFQQNLRMESEKAKRELSKKDKYTLTVNVNIRDQGTIPLDHNLTRGEFEDIVRDILNDMIKPLDSLLSRGDITKKHVKDLYLVGGTVQIPELRRLLKDYFPNVTPDRTFLKDPVQGVSRGAAKFGAVIGGIVNATWQPYVDTIPLPVKIVVDHDKMHEVFERSQLYPCTANVSLTTYANNQTAIVIQVYEGECNASTDRCQFLGEFKLSGIPPHRKGVPKIHAIFTVNSNGILIVTASYIGEKMTLKNEMNLDVYSKTGSMSVEKIAELSSLVRQLVSPNPTDKPKCSLLENIPPMTVIPKIKPNKSNVLKLAVDSECGGVKMYDGSNPDANLSVDAMVTINGFLPNSKDILKTVDLDIVLIVDKSQSMEGSRMKTMQNLILHLINSILKENHRLGVVSFDDEAHRLIKLDPATKSNKERASNIINGTKASGETNTYEGLLEGLKMAYEGGRRACVMLFTDGNPSVGVKDPDDILEKIVAETVALKASSPRSQVDLHTFAIFGYKDRKDFLLNLAGRVGEGSYHNVNNKSDLAAAFAYVVSNAINQIAENIEITVTPSPNRVRIEDSLTQFRHINEADKLIIKIPTLADQQFRHVPLKLTVLPTIEKTNYEELLHVEMKYKNVITNGEENCDEYLYVARTHHWMEENPDVIEQHNRVKVAKKMKRALKYVKKDNRRDTVDVLEEAKESITKNSSLSMCMRNELAELILLVKSNLETAKMPLEESLKSHWNEKGGWSSCYLTRKEHTMITLVSSDTTATDAQIKKIRRKKRNEEVTF